MTKPKKSQPRFKVGREWDSIACIEDGVPLSYRDLVNEELSHLSPLTKEYLRECAREHG